MNNTSTASEETCVRISYSFKEEINVFIKHIDSLYTSLPLSMLLIQAASSKAFFDYKEFLEPRRDVSENSSEENELYTILPADFQTFKMLGKEVENFGTALEVLPRSFIVALISQYDAFLGRLIRTIFYVKPELLNASEKQLSFSKLLAFSSIEVAREHIIEKEVESILRESHTDQFKWLENKVGGALTKDLPVWIKFIEITERRNLFVHTNGVVSEQYLNVCRLNNIDSANGCKVGDKLEVTDEYFRDAYMSVFEVGIKLAHVLWRKLQPEQREDADSNLNNICYELRAYPKTSECVIEPVCFVWMEQNNGSQTHSENNMAYSR